MESFAQNQSNPGITKVKIITGVAIAFLFPLLMSVLVAALPLNYWSKVYLSRFIFWVEVLMLWFYARKVEKQTLLIWPEKSSGFQSLVISIVILYVLTIIAQVLSSIPVLLGYHEHNKVMKQIAALVHGRPGLIVFISLTAGFCEEVVFRGYLLTRLSLLFKDKITPVVISSLLFAAMHYRYNMLREYIFSFLIGIIFSVYYQRFGNIRPLIIVHFIIDVIGLFTVARFLK